MVNSSVGLSISKQCKILNINRSSYYYKKADESTLNLKLMRIIDELYLNYPFYGSRQIRHHLRQLNYQVSRKRIQRLMRKMGIMAIYPKPNTSLPNKDHKVYPYLLRNLLINRPNQVWCSDISYIPTKNGFMYLVAIQDWYSRKVLSWRLSNTLDTNFCIEALKEALSIYDHPEIFNTDQGSQFTSYDFIDGLKDAGISISMDGKGCWMDNVFIERLWRSVKYECVYLNEFETGKQAKHHLGKWFYFYNHIRPHSTFNGQTPEVIYNAGKWLLEKQELAA
jgi:putative transposase